MKAISQRTAIYCMIVSVIVFTIALTAFCYSLGLDFTNEGWSKTDGDSTSIVKYGWLSSSIFGFGVSTVLFFIGLHRVARS